MIYFVFKYDELAERRCEKGMSSDCAKIVAIKNNSQDLRFYLHRNLPSLGEHEKFVVIEHEGMFLNLLDKEKFNELTPT